MPYVSLGVRDISEGTRQVAEETRMTEMTRLFEDLSFTPREPEPDDADEPGSRVCMPS